MRIPSATLRDVIGEDGVGGARSWRRWRHADNRHNIGVRGKEGVEAARSYLGLHRARFAAVREGRGEKGVVREQEEQVAWCVRDAQKGG